MPERSVAPNELVCRWIKDKELYALDLVFIQYADAVEPVLLVTLLLADVATERGRGRLLGTRYERELEELAIFL